MSDDDDLLVLGSIKAPPSALKEVLEEVSVSGGSEEPIFGTLYFNITDGRLQTLASVGANSAMTYATFTGDGPLDDITMHRSNGDDDGAAAMFWVGELLSYIDLVGGNDEDGSATIQFKGRADDDIATVANLRGGLNAEVYLPASSSDINAVPFGVMDRFNDDDEFYKQMPTNDDPHPGTFPTVIDTTIDEMNRIVDVVDEADSPDIYPVKVEDGEFKIDLRTREASRDTVWGTLHRSDVAGPDVDSEYSNRFKKLASTLNGSISLSTTEGNAPLVAVQSSPGKVLRYIVAPVQET